MAWTMYSYFNKGRRWMRFIRRSSKISSQVFRIVIFRKYPTQFFKVEIVKPFTAIDISKRYNDFDPEIEAQKVFEDSVTTFPVHDEQMMFKLHKKYSEVEIDVTYRNIFHFFFKFAKFEGKINILNLFGKM